MLVIIHVLLPDDVIQSIFRTHMTRSHTFVVGCHLRHVAMVIPLTISFDETVDMCVWFLGAVILLSDPVFVQVISAR